MTDHRPHLRALAEALPPGSAVPVPVEWLLDLLGPSSLPPATAARALAGEPEDRLLTVEEAARRLNVTKDWLYHHRKELPFAVKLGRKQLRFSAAKLERYLEARRRGTAA